MSGRRLGVPVEEAAKLLGCSRSTVYALLERGELGSYTLGRTRRVTVSSIEELTSGRVGDHAST